MGRPRPAVREDDARLGGVGVCPWVLPLVVMMAQAPADGTTPFDYSGFPPLLVLLLFGLGLCISGRYISIWERGRHESRLHLAWGVLSASAFECAGRLVSVCFFSAHTGAWAAKPTLWNAFWNPAFPAVFLTWAAVSILTFGAFGLLYAASRKDSAWRVALVHELGKWMVAGAVTGVLGWIWWGVSLPESENRNLVIGLVATAVAAQAVLGPPHSDGASGPEKRQRRHACAASCCRFPAGDKWVVYVEAREISRSTSICIERNLIMRSGDANQGFVEFRHLGEPPGAGGTRRIQFPCACRPAMRIGEAAGPPGPGVKFEGDALRFLGEMRTKHPPYPHWRAAQSAAPAGIWKR